MDRNTFLSKAKLKTQDVEIPDMGSIRIRELSAKQVSQYAKQHKQGTDEVSLLTSLVIGSVVDESGNPLFTDADAEKLANLPLSILKIIADTAAELAGILDADESKKS